MKFCNLDRQYQAFKPELDEAYYRVMESGQYILGEEVIEFEKEWAAYCGVSNCVGVASGLDALTLALKACHIGPGDEVIVPANTYIATWLAVSLAGAYIKPVEPGLDFCIDPKKIERAINRRTKAIIPVHLYGHVCDMLTICTIANRYGIKVISDSAQAHGARHMGYNVSKYGDVNCWSFYPTKNLGAHGDAGAVTTNNDLIARRVRTLRSYGEVRKYHNVEIGYNSRMDPLQAAFLRVKMPYLLKMNQRRREIAHRYMARINILFYDVPPITGYDVYHQFVIKPPKRDELKTYLAKHDIPTMIHYPIPPHLSEAYQSKIDLPISEDYSRRILSLPIDPFLKDSEIDHVTRMLKKYWMDYGYGK